MDATNVQITIEKRDNEVTIFGDVGDRRKKIVLPTKLFNLLTSINTPVSNGDLQRMIAETMMLPISGGRSSKAASLLERFTPGYRSFNGWCALLVGTEIGKRRFYQSNTDLGAVPDASMLTKQGEVKDAAAVKRKLIQEDLDAPEPTADDMNYIIDEAYRKLGFDPNDLPEHAPDLTYADAVATLNN